MPCFKPLVAARKSTGGVAVLRRKRHADLDVGEFVVPCSQCIGCRLDYSKSWAVRSIHESRMHRRNAFVTLTYDEEHVPWDYSLSLDEHQSFMRKLRRKLDYKYGVQDVRFYMCGEYGSDQYHPVTGELLSLGRPHYHYLIFGWDFPDKTFWKRHRQHDYFRSEELESIWTKGHSIIGHVTPETAAYTARYVLKKKTGKQLKYEPPQKYIDGYGLTEVMPEFCRMSLKPGIGAKWFERYGKQDVFDSGDFIIINGKKYSTPRYYDTLLERLDVDRLLEVKSERRDRARQHNPNNTYERLSVREEIQQMKADKLIRGYENGKSL